jgi:hypothetical protein
MPVQQNASFKVLSMRTIAFGTVVLSWQKLDFRGHSFDRVGLSVDQIVEQRW